MYLYGASGHAKVIIDILLANQVQIDGLFDDNDSIRDLLGYPVLKSSDVRGPLIMSIGNNQIRKKISERLHVSWGMAVHPSAIVSETAGIDEGTVVMQGLCTYFPSLHVVWQCPCWRRYMGWRGKYDNTRSKNRKMEYNRSWFCSD